MILKSYAIDEPVSEVRVGLLLWPAVVHLYELRHGCCSDVTEMYRLSFTPAENVARSTGSCEYQEGVSEARNPASRGLSNKQAPILWPGNAETPHAHPVALVCFLLRAIAVMLSVGAI